MSAIISAETGLDTDRLAACCAPVPGLSPVVETLRVIYASVKQISWNKDRCRKLSSKALSLVFIICDHYDNERSDLPELQDAIGRAVRVIREIQVDVQEWAALSIWRSWNTRHQVEVRINEHEENLKILAEFSSLADPLAVHDRFTALQESLKNNPSGSAERRQAEKQLYRLRKASPEEQANLIPPELACECVRLGSEPEYSGTRNIIWKGRWLDMQDVALISSGPRDLALRTEKGIRKFDREIKFWRKLDSPFVIPLYGWCKFDGETYLVSPWLPNRDVRRYLGGDPDRHRKCVSLVLEMARGLCYLHLRDIFHGAIQPSNILVGDDGRAVLSDLLSAKALVEEGKNSQTNPQVNVFRYQSPEVIMDEPILKASDVYSWAMTALEIMTGDPPFRTCRSPGQLVAQIIKKQQIQTRTEYQSPVLDKHPEVWELFVRCWSWEPIDRPEVKDIIKVLEAIPDYY